MGFFDRLLRKKGTKAMTDPVEDRTLNERLVALERLWFLADTPLFIDGELVERLYDAVFRPEVELASRSDSVTKEWAAKITASTKVAAEAGIKVPPLLSLFGLDVLNAKASIDASASGEGSTRRALTESGNYVAVKSTEGHLEKVISLYAEKYRERVFWVGKELTSGHSLDKPNAPLTWDEMGAELDRSGPRPLVIFDLGPGSRLMPMFGELANGKGHELVKDYLAGRATKDETEYPVPKYPSGALAPDKESAQRRQYWQKVYERFDSHQVIRGIEAAGGEERERFDWIDFRAMVDLDQSSPMFEPPHLHFMARGAYPTGTFAYQFVRRAHRFGVRIVGTLKKGQDVNVLAVYER